MDELSIVRGMALRIGAGGEDRLRRALDGWADTHADWLGLGETHDWPAAREALLRDVEAAAPAHVLAVADVLADVLALPPFDAALLKLLIAVLRLPRVAGLATVWSAQGRDLPRLLGELAGADALDAERAVRRSGVLRLGLVRFGADDQGVKQVAAEWALDRLLDRASADRASVVAQLAGPAQAAVLACEDFAHVADVGFLVALLRGAAAARAPGVNILIHGPPGTGKTELARTLAAAAGLPLHAVGEADLDGDEPARWERVCALNLAQRVMGSAGEAVLLFDEMEDLIGNSEPTSTGAFNGRPGSKLFVNRLLETNAVPVIWTTNTIGNVDSAILRRMSFVLKLGLPGPASARRMLARISAEEGDGRIDPGLEALLVRVPETASVLRVAARAARLAGAEGAAARPAAGLVQALRGEAFAHVPHDAFDLGLYETDQPLAPLLDRLAEACAGDVSFLLTGPPGTGKTALAQGLADALDRPLVTKRASDLLSRWVGGTEKAIAHAFAEAREQEHVLLFDEVDSLLFDRAGVQQSWEAGQVNEMLTWLDRHPLPVIAATNHAHRLDPAALRRFAFKIELKPLGRARAAHAFRHFLGMEAPDALAELTTLTPGDFAAVRRQLRHAPAAGPEEMLERLRAEVGWRPECGRIGF